MNKAPEQIWVHSYDDKFDGDCDVLQEHCIDGTSYTRTDVVQAMVAAAYEAAAEYMYQQWDDDAQEHRDSIRALTPTDAKAALDRIVQDAVKEALENAEAETRELRLHGTNLDHDRGWRGYNSGLDRALAVLAALKGGEA